MLCSQCIMGLAHNSTRIGWLECHYLTETQIIIEFEKVISALNLMLHHCELRNYFYPPMIVLMINEQVYDDSSAIFVTLQISKWQDPR